MFLHPTRPLRGLRALVSVAVVSTLVSACDEDLASVDVEPSTQVSALRVDGPVLPAEDRQIYLGYAQPWTASEVFPIEALAVHIESIGEDRTVEVRRGNAIEGPVLVDSNGEVPVHVPEMAVGQDALAALPREGMVLTVGEAFESTSPNPAFVLENYAHGEMTMWQRAAHTPVFFETTNFGTVVRLRSEVTNALTTVDPNAEGLLAATPELRTIEVGLAYVGITDLLHIPGQGWRVLQFVRWSPAEKGMEPSFEGIQAGPHHLFAACGEFETVDEATIADARRALPSHPELALCR